MQLKHHATTGPAALTQLDFDIEPEKRLTDGIKENTKQFKTEKKWETLKKNIQLLASQNSLFTGHQQVLMLGVF